MGTLAVAKIAVTVTFYYFQPSFISLAGYKFPFLTKIVHILYTLHKSTHGSKENSIDFHFSPNIILVLDGLLADFFMVTRFHELLMRVSDKKYALSQHSEIHIREKKECFISH